MPTYRYNADHIAAARGKYNPQKKNMGMFEWHIDGLVPGGQEILSLSLASITIPGYTVTRGEIHYLNGVVFYPQKPEPLGEITVVYKDYTDSGTREVLTRLFYKVYDPRTGLMGRPADIKSQGSFILLREDDGPGRTYDMDGVFLMSEPTKEFDFTTGEQSEIEVTLSADSVVGR